MDKKDDMGKRLRVLNVEDSKADVDLLKLHLTHAGYEIDAETVETAETMSAALKAKEWDIILCDYSMPHFNALLALEVLRGSGLDIPFIIISGTVGEEIAVEAMLTGAHDYVSKDNLTRLVPAIERELKEATNRNQLRWEGEERRVSEARYRTLFEYAPDGIIISGPDDFYLDANASMCQMLGYSHQDLVGMHASDIVIRSEARELDSEFALVQSTPGYNREWHFRRKDGSVFPAEVIATIMPDGNLLAMIRDVSERNAANAALLESEERFSGAFELAPIGVALVLPDGTWLKVNLALCDLVGYTETELLAGKFQDITHPDDLALDLDNMRRLVDGEIEHYQIEKRYKHKLGHFISALLNVSLVRDTDGKPRYFISQIQDITERKHADAQLRESEALLAASQRITHLGSWVMDISESGDAIEKTERWSDEHYRIFGYEPGEIEVTDELFYNSVHPEDREPLAKMLRETIEHQKPYDIEHRIILPDGTERIVHAMAEVVHVEETGKVHKLLGSVQDITESKRAVAALAESEERYRDLVENAIDVIYTLDLNGNYTSMNKAGELLSGYSRDESLTRNIADSIVPEYREKALQMISAQIEGQDISSFEIEIENKHGRHIVLDVNTRAIKENGVTVGVQGIARDITDRKLADVEIQEKSAWLEAQLNSSIDGILIVDENGKQIIQNQQLIDIFKIPKRIANDPDDAKQVKWVTALMKDPDKFIDKVLYLYANPTEVSRDEVELKDGTILDRYSAPVFGKDNKNYGRIWKFRDITADKLAEATLRESELRLRTIIDTEPECVKLLARDGSLLEMNAAGLRMIEADSFEQVANAKVVGMIVEQDRKAFRNLTKRVFRGESGMLEFQINGLKGTRRWLDTHASPLRDASGQITALLGITRDITEQKRAEKERKIIFEIIQGAITSHGLSEFLELVHRSIGRLVYAENFIVMLHDAATEHFKYEFWADKFDPPPPPRPVGKGFSSYVLRTGQPLVLTQALKKELVDRGDAFLSGTPSRSWIGIPLRTPTQTIGVMVLQHYEVENAYDQSDLEFLSSVGDQIALAIERQRAESAVRESNEKFQQLADNISDVFWVRSLDMQEVYYVSPAFEKIWGRSVASLLADPHEWANFVFAEDRPRVKKAFDALQKDSSSLDIEYRIVRPDDSIRWIRVRGFPVEDSTGTLIRFAGIVTDTTERKKAAEALVDSEERYRELVENALDIIYTHDLKGNYTSANRAAETITGYTHTEIMAKNIADTIPADQLEKAKNMIAAKLAGEPVTAYELELLTKDGRGVQVEVNTRIIYENGIPVGVQGIARDITERKSTREALESSERTLRELADQLESDRKRLVEAQTLAKVGSWHTDLVTGELIWSAETFRIFNVDPETRDMDHRSFLQNVHPDDRDAVDSAFTDSMDKDSECEINHRVLLADGSVKYVEERWQIVHDDDGKPLRAIGSARDVTERTIVAQALEAAEENYRSIFENAVEGIFQSTLDGAFISANPAMARILGFDSPADLLASRTDIGSQHYVDPASRIELSAILDEYGIAAAYECEVYQKDGTKIWTQENIRTIRRPDGGILHYEGSLEDITERKTLEDQFRQSQKMEAIGVLAGGIAHDFNNLLTAINGYSDLTLRKMPADDPLRHNVEEVKKAGDRAAELTSQLLAFSRKQVLKPMVHGLNTVIGNIENMLRRIIRENIELRTVLDPTLGNIKADPGQVEQIIMNLSVNARDAMPHGGTLTIETQNVYLDEDYVSQNLTIAPGPFVKLTVTDTGMGMDEITKRHIFEPFFTTKEVGKGTGLGLSMVYGVVKQSGGDIMVYSELDHGTTFKVYLPRVDENVGRPRWTGERKQMYLGTETVLLVEDEDVVRNLVHEILTENGYNVLECNSGDAALKVCSSYDKPIHLLLSDVIMPKMSGSELKDAVVKILPDIKILFMSGYTDDSIANRGVFDDDIAFIEKPFTPDGLARKVREVLEY